MYITNYKAKNTTVNNTSKGNKYIYIYIYIYERRKHKILVKKMKTYGYIQKKNYNEETRSLINNQSLHLNHTYDPTLYNLENLLT